VSGRCIWIDLQVALKYNKEQPDAIQAGEVMPIRVVRDQAARMRHEVHIGQHVLPVDESPEMGGEDSGPSAHDLYDAALGACKALTVLWYANRKTIPVQGIEVLVTRDSTQERAGIY